MKATWDHTRRQLRVRRIKILCMSSSLTCYDSLLVLRYTTILRIWDNKLNVSRLKDEIKVHKYSIFGPPFMTYSVMDPGFFAREFKILWSRHTN